MALVIEMTHNTCVVQVKKIDSTIHLLDLGDIHMGTTLTNSINRDFQDDVLRKLMTDSQEPNDFTWVLYHTDSWISKFVSGGFMPLGETPPDSEWRSRMIELYGDSEF